MFWLSHHHPDEYNRTYSFGGVRICARCLGTYPALFAGLVLLFAQHAPLSWRYDGLWALALPVPALVDWSIGRFRPAFGNNGIRTLTGILLGASLARTLYIHLQRPLPLWLLLQLGLVTAVAVPVMLAARLRKAQKA